MVRWLPRNVRRAVKPVIILATTLFLLHLSGILNLDLSTRRYDTWPWTSCSSSSSFDPSCTASSSRVTIAQDVQIIVETGGSEPQSRLKVQLASVLSKIPSQNILIFSDLEEDVGDFHVHDVYAGISVQERGRYPELVLYDKQQEYIREGRNTRELQGGWKMAKYKNLAMKRKMWEVQKTLGGSHLAAKKWFVFIDTDTVIDWDNLLALLEHLDPTKKQYLGSPVWTPELEFGHGGSAYVMSHAAIAALNKPSSKDNSTLFFSQYGLNVTALCCGDLALGMVLKSKGIKLKGYWPLFNGEVPSTVAFGEDTWCEPVISLHHMVGEDMEELWKWIDDWKARTRNMRPFLYKDLFDYVTPQLTNIMENWDGIDTENSRKMYPRSKDGHLSLSHCKIACEADNLCFQYVFDGTTCSLSHHIRIGRRREPEHNGTKQYFSGWNMQRIQDWTKKTECTSAHWVRSNP